MGTVQTVAPSTEPVTVAELKLHCRVEHSADDDLFTALGKAARETVEAETGRQLVTATWRQDLDEFPLCPIKLRHPPLISVTSVVYTDANGDTQTLDASDYQVDTSSVIGTVAPAVDSVWPTTQAYKLNAVRITYQAGFGAASAVPESIKAAIKLLVGHWYENREAAQDKRLEMMPMGVQALIVQNWCGEY